MTNVLEMMRSSVSMVWKHSHPFIPQFAKALYRPMKA